MTLADPFDADLSISIMEGIEAASCPDHTRLSRLAALVFSGEKHTLASLGIVFGNHETVLALNNTWLGHDWHTDVISFLLEEDPVEGEIYIDVETAQERHEEFGVTIRQELERYAVHGMLHLCGHDDATTEQRDAMRLLEDRYLTLLDA